jgi:hypothetical protein
MAIRAKFRGSASEKMGDNEMVTLNAVASADPDDPNHEFSDDRGSRMNVDTGFMGEMDEVRRRALPGERVIPATIIPAPGKYANKKSKRRTLRAPTPVVATGRVTAPVYGPRKPLREVRDELERLRRGHQVIEDEEA